MSGGVLVGGEAAGSAGALGTSGERVLRERAAGGLDGSGRGTLAARAYDLLDECGHPVAADVLVAHCFGVAPRRNPEFWRGQLARVLADDETFVQDAAGAWGLRAWTHAEAAFEVTRYVVVDVETTGLSARSHRIIEVAAIRCRGAQVLEAFSELVDPRRRIPAFIRDFTGITPEMLEGMPEVADVLPRFLDFVGADPLVGHNISFDLGFLHAELARCDAGLTLTNPALDTGRLASSLLPRLGKPSLDRLCAALDLPVGRRHRAGDDALLTARAFGALAARAREQGIVTFSGLRGLAVPARSAATSPAAALRGQRRTGRTLLDPKLRQNVPQKPGVYLMKDAAGEVIYVGKAKRLRDRISSYYAQPLGYTRKMDGLLESVHALETIVVGSELEALLVESRLIKHYLPRFNVQQRYYAHYPFIKVDVGSAYPRVAACREIASDGARYFGPYRSMRAVRTTIELVHRLFPIRTCTRALHAAPPAATRTRRASPPAEEGTGKARRRGAAPCLRYQLGRCLGPCHGNVSVTAYGAVVDEVLAFLGGGREGMLDRIRRELHAAAERWEYERAARLRDLLQEVGKVLVAQQMLDGAVEQHNVLLLAPSAESAAVEVLGIRHGRLHAQHRLVLPAADDAGTEGGAGAHGAGADLAAFLRRLHEAPSPPRTVGQHEVDQIAIISRWILQHPDERTTLPLPAQLDQSVVEDILDRAHALLRRLAAGGEEAAWDGDDEAPAAE